MSEINKIQKRLTKTFGERVTAVREGDTIRVSGMLSTWPDIVKACNMAVSKDKRRVHVVNDITLEGAEPIPMRVPSVRDESLDGKHVDVLVIGGGISGTSIARELSKWDLSVLLVEKEADFALQASGRNDGESRVVPAMSVTICRSSPIKALINEDLPALGRPMTAIRGNSSSRSSSLSAGKAVMILSNRSPV